MMKPKYQTFYFVTFLLLQGCDGCYSERARGAGEIYRTINLQDSSAKQVDKMEDTVYYWSIENGDTVRWYELKKHN